jgi:hypothetical protein
LLAAYGVDVLDPKVSLRRVHVLIENLPPYARRGGEHWSVESDLLAGVIDYMAVLTYVMLKANGAKGAKKPQPIPRPGERDRRQRVAVPQHRAAGGPVQTSGWAEAATALAGVPGVRVRSG